MSWKPTVSYFPLSLAAVLPPACPYTPCAYTPPRVSPLDAPSGRLASAAAVFATRRTLFSCPGRQESGLALEEAEEHNVRRKQLKER
jgi:hypothetical protein